MRRALMLTAIVALATTAGADAIIGSGGRTETETEAECSRYAVGAHRTCTETAPADTLRENRQPRSRATMFTRSVLRWVRR